MDLHFKIVIYGFFAARTSKELLDYGDDFDYYLWSEKAFELAT